jgi:hypothetical protein
MARVAADLPRDPSQTRLRETLLDAAFEALQRRDDLGGVELSVGQRSEV